MAEVISTYARLTEALDSLPAPAPGHVRVFRGQNRDYQAMIPTGLRGPHAADVIWPVYASSLAADIREHAGEDVEVGDDLGRMLLWVHAIKQHYGPGTEFLDVTHSPGIAAWFALHRMDSVDAQAIYGPPGPFDPRTDVLGKHVFARYVGYEEEPAFLYVFDAVEGTGATDRNHGTLFDLALAPSAFSSSARIRAQQACLIYADGDVEGGDLASFFVPGTPLRIGWPLEGSPEAGWATNDLFPPACDDDWYARFVAVPLTPNLGESLEHTVYDHPIRTTLYLPQGSGDAKDDALLRDLTDRFVVLHPPLLYAYKLISGELPDATSHPLWQQFDSATPLLLEGPMLTLLPAIDSDFLNVGLLATDFADTAPARDFASGRPAESVGLRNVFVELSGLDAAGWERSEAGDGTVEIVRGIWLVREADRFFLTLFVDQFPEGGYIAGPIEIAYDAQSVAFLMRGTAPSAVWAPLLDQPWVARLFVKALTLVRSLAPGWKVSAWAEARIDDVSFVWIDWALGELVSLRDLEGPVSRYYALRLWGTDEPFFGGAPPDSPARGGAIRVEGPPLAQTDPHALLELAAPLLAQLGQRPPQ